MGNTCITNTFIIANLSDVMWCLL